MNYTDYGLFGDQDLRIYACGKSMTKAKDKKNPLDYMWRCRKKNGCKQSESPLKGTFFAKTGLPFSDVMAFIINFVKQEGTRNGMEMIEDWRKRSQRKRSNMSKTTYKNYMSTFRAVCETVAVNDFYNKPLGGPRLSVEIDETFLSKWKYARGRMPKSITLLGITCQEQKRSLYWRVDGKYKAILWPKIKKHVHPETTFIYTDSAKQYSNVQTIFDDALHGTVNHSKGEFVQL